MTLSIKWGQRSQPLPFPFKHLAKKDMWKVDILCQRRKRQL